MVSDSVMTAVEESQAFYNGLQDEDPRFLALANKVAARFEETVGELSIADAPSTVAALVLIAMARAYQCGMERGIRECSSCP